MDNKKILKIAGLNIGIALLNIILLSPGLGNIWDLGVLGIALGGTEIFMSIVVFFYGNYKLVLEKNTPIKITDIKSHEDCIRALKQSYGKKIFDNDITLMLEQVERLVKKKEKISDLLLHKFNVIDASFEKFRSTIFDVEYVFYANTKSILNKINAFDEEDYDRIRYDSGSRRFSAEVITSKRNIYNEYITFVKEAIEDNEELIIKLDALLLEISKFDSLEAGEIENMKEIKEMDELIRKSKYYR
ncbi:MAG: hypothetical protein GX660_21780 [Clostridiaceae bacterium]|nr:hypothetical protein [Clostridiaceae bacterium]